MNNNKRILVFSATYNEIDNIRELINNIQKYLPSASILIVDDNSPDKTYEVIKELKDEKKKSFSYSTREKIRFRFGA